MSHKWYPNLGAAVLEIHEEQILAYLQENHPGKTLEDVADPGVIIQECYVLRNSRDIVP